MFKNIVSWIVHHFHLGDVRTSRALGEMAWGLMKSQVVSFAAIGRGMESDAFPASSMTRTFHWCHHPKIDPGLVQQTLVDLFVGKALVNSGDRRLAMVAIDWHTYNNGAVSSLRISLMTGSRALPLLWYECRTSELSGRQVEIECQAIQALDRLRPLGVTWKQLHAYVSLSGINTTQDSLFDLPHRQTRTVGLPRRRRRRRRSIQPIESGLQRVA